MKRVRGIGSFLFAAVFCYLLVSMIAYMSRNHIAPYEVSEGTIVEDSVYTGVIVRQERSVKSPRSGYLSYYLDDKSKSGRYQHVCAISGKDLKDRLSEADNGDKKLSSAQESVMLSSIQNYLTTVTRHDYSKLHELHDEIESSSGITSSDYAAEQIEQLVEDGSDIDYIDAPSDGLVVYMTDSLDGLTQDKISEDIFDQKSYSEHSIRQSSKVRKGEPVFKIITDESWAVIFPVNKEIEKKIRDKKMIETCIGNSPHSIWGKCKIIERNGKKYGRLTYSSDMLMYASQRFVSVELILQNDTGLKLPRSSVVKKDVYEIPEEYVVTDPDTQRTGVQKVGEDGKRSFAAFDVFYRKDGNVYAKTSAFDRGQVIGKDNDDKTYQIGKKKKFKGVYNINKGYAVFQAIDIIASNQTYYVIDEHSPYGPQLYDHIALNASKLTENKVVQTSR